MLDPVEIFRNIKHEETAHLPTADFVDIEPLPYPTEEVVAEAVRIVNAMEELQPYVANRHGEIDSESRAWFEIYAMDEERVAVEVSSGYGKRFLLLCEPGGSAYLTAVIHRADWSRRYNDSSILPDDFMREQLNRLT